MAGMFACCVADSQDDLPIEETVVKVVEKVPEAAPATPVEPEPVAKRADGSQVGFVLTFELPDKTMRDINFTSRPLGIDFSRSLPLTVKRVKPESPGLSQGVSEGWVLKYLAGASVPDTFDGCLEQLKEHVTALPTK
ncbi:unnamed protein product [Polarella glacialis]|uniref:Uncharacterized protein n=1 Tax=Polarella glacialis TaxID=89957 RepID=A0A813KPM9_POLGL|nr:unnamed protein product [Polarella glacialis]CAE8693273.1 unnamed protein product [Polarella glacialis]CAE8709734.1 unnamed protein product [Polarella glacialis]